MRPEIVDLDQFYTTRLGQVSRRLIRRRLQEIWPDEGHVDIYRVVETVNQVGY